MNIDNYKKVVKLRHELHSHPELSNQEEWTKEHIKKFIRENTELEIVDKGYYFYVAYRTNSSENIAFRADIDALPIEETIDIPHASKFPGISHKCGHDGHAATLCGLCLEVDQKKPNKNIFFVFQPAEETGDGAKVAAEFIDIENITEIYAYHNMSGKERGSINVIDGTAQFASKGMSIYLEGSPSHASEPEKGKNPAFAIANIINSIPDFTSSENNEGMVLCTIVQVDLGEKAFGVNASKGVVRMTIRAYYERDLDKLQLNLENKAKKEAEKYGLRFKFEYNDEFPETSNIKEVNDKIRIVTKKLGYKLNELGSAYRASEDFGHYLKRTKGTMIYIGNGEDYPALHTYEYDFPDDIIKVAVNVFKGIIEL